MWTLDDTFSLVSEPGRAGERFSPPLPLSHPTGPCVPHPGRPETRLSPVGGVPSGLCCHLSLGLVLSTSSPGRTGALQRNSFESVCNVIGHALFLEQVDFWRGEVFLAMCESDFFNEKETLEITLLLVG